MKRFICYIGCAFLVFNLFCGVVEAEEKHVSSEVAEIKDNGTSDVAEGKDNSASEVVVENSVSEVAVENSASEVVVENSASEVAVENSASEVAVENSASEGTKSLEKEGALAQTNKAQSESLMQHIHNEIAKFFFLPFVADKLYQGNKINDDLSGIILTFYPKADEEDIQNLTTGIRFFVKWKRKYDYVVEKLKHQIKAAKMLPKDAPIVAREGEYAPTETDLTKQSGSGEYVVRYKPYKYLEYDAGEYGEPVRRMDKNYVTTDETTYAELVLALLQFDMRAFVKAWQNIPASTDGAGERFQSFTENGEIRLLADSSLLGEQKKIRAAFDILVPDGFYINGDVLNPQNKLGFVLSETELKTDNGTVYRPSKNVSAYQIYQPLADGIQDKKQQTHRVLSGRVRVPVEFERADTSKSMRISGAFRFVLCSAKGECQPIVSYHELTLRQGKPAESSIFVNYITQGLAKYPLSESKHVKVKDVVYNAEKSQLTVQFEGTNDVSNMAVMVEDAKGSNFINPRYEMKQSGGQWVGKAYFDLKAPQLSAAMSPISENEEALTDNGMSDGALPEVAISASFDNQEFLRLITQPRLADGGGTLSTYAELKWWMLLGFGFLLNLMPGVMALCFNLMTLLWQKEERRRIFARYVLMSALGLMLMALGAKYWLQPEIYLHPLVLVGVGAIGISLMMEHLGYIDFALFRPLRQWLKFGVLTVLFTLVLFVFIPMPYKTEIFDVLGRQADTLSLGYQMTAWGLIWLGMIILPLSAFVITPRSTYVIWFMTRINQFYTPVLLAWLLWICGAVYSLWAVLVMGVFLALIAMLWYWFPIAVGEAIKHSRSSMVQAGLFFKVQKHWLFMLVFLMALSVGGLYMLMPTQVVSNSEPIFASVTQAEKRSAQQPLLVTIGAPYSPRSLMNLRVLAMLKDAGLPIVEIDALENPQEALYWFKRYQHFYPPFSVLFTERHPYGLVLPQDLKSVDFNKAVSGW